MVFIQPEAQKFLDLNKDAPQLDTRTPEENRAAQQKTAAAWGKKTPMGSVYETSVRGVTVRSPRLPMPHQQRLPLSSSAAAAGCWGI